MLRARDLIDLVLEGLDPFDVAEAFAEDWGLIESWAQIKRRAPGGARDVRLSRMAGRRYEKHRQTYKAAMRDWLRDPRAKAFYRRLGRWNASHRETHVPRLAGGDPARGMTPFLITPKRSWGWD